MACDPDPCGPDPRVGKLERANEKLIAEIQLLEEYGKQFEEAYLGLIDELDQVNFVKDSLYAIKDDIESYDPALFQELERKLSDAQKTIDELKKELENSGSSSSIMGVLRMQLEQAESRIAYLEKANSDLVTENNRMKELLEEENRSRLAAEAEAKKAEEALEAAKDELKDLEVQTQNELDENIKEQKAVAAAAKIQMIEAASYYEKAMKGFLALESYIVTRNNGNYKIKKKGVNKSDSLSEAREIARSVFDNLAEASRLGHPNSEKALNKLTSERKYEAIRPLGLDEF